ncbi:hypothetical protein [Stackebrandtia nassauensis]|uniref:Uncharacterized protein n=1 Tax=Stackebrandtia nassauensis (strain DSM 44728 / CIP 108903 / NRRL B-16338 / NBRC 102104 / LLR-40K-21) TaxID=446470 RepID=D3Q9Z4_STANL|nr:hypothetical protein [Stackebrandtia nassauensis]ADD40706.1 hypothetical protein Snas_0996 [Stackebrandtia nassauensis DSM 44728]
MSETPYRRETAADEVISPFPSLVESRRLLSPEPEIDEAPAPAPAASASAPVPADTRDAEPKRSLIRRWLKSRKQSDPQPEPEPAPPQPLVPVRRRIAELMDKPEEEAEQSVADKAVKAAPKRRELEAAPSAPEVSDELAAVDTVRLGGDEKQPVEEAATVDAVRPENHKRATIDSGKREDGESAAAESQSPGGADREPAEPVRYGAVFESAPDQLRVPPQAGPQVGRLVGAGAGPKPPTPKAEPVADAEPVSKALVKFTPDVKPSVGARDEAAAAPKPQQAVTESKAKPEWKETVKKLAAAVSEADAAKAGSAAKAEAGDAAKQSIATKTETAVAEEDPVDEPGEPGLDEDEPAPVLRVRGPGVPSGRTYKPGTAVEAAPALRVRGPQLPPD